MDSDNGLGIARWALSETGDSSRGLGIPEWSVGETGDVIREMRAGAAPSGD